MKTLHLTLKKKWFDMIESGEKTEEYRDLKDYWYNRLMTYELWSHNNVTPRKRYIDFKDFDFVSFRHGYSKYARTMKFKMNEIRITTGFSDWGASKGVEYFVIKLGERID